MRIIAAIMLTFSLLFSVQSTSAQGNALLEISGEDFYEVCAPWCSTFQLYLSPDFQWSDIQFELTPPFGGTFTSNDSTLFTLCIEEQGTYQFIASALASTPTSEFIVSDTIYIVAFGFGFLDQIVSDACPSDSIGSSNPEDCLRACEYSQVSYYLQTGQGDPGQWFVQGADSYTDNGVSVDVTWGAAGQGFVSFNPFNTQCDRQVEVCVDIIPLPVADFNSIPPAVNSIIEVCVGQPIYFENTSQNALRYEWTFGDGVTSGLYEPEHMYATPGNYTIALNAYNICECVNTRYIEVVVLSAPAPELSCVATVCPGEQVRYTASTDGCQTFHWTVSGNGAILSGGGLTDDFIEIAWGAGPDGFVDLLVEDCNTSYCAQVATFRIPIVSTNGPITGDARVCSGELVTYKAPYFPGVNYTWTSSGRGTIVSGQNTNAVSIQWANVSSVQSNENVSVTYGHCYLGCSGSDQLNVSIVPNIAINSNNQFCEEENGTFSSTAGFFAQTPVVSDWELYNDEGSIVWTSPASDDEVIIPLNYQAGDYTIVAIPINPADVCEDRVERDFIITPIPATPLAILGDSFICPGQPYAYESDNAGNYQTLWTIIDGASIFNYEGQIITHTFGNTPPYTVLASHAHLLYPACQSETISRIIFPATTAVIIGADENCLEEATIYEVYELPGNILEWRVEPSDMAEVSNKYSKQASFYWVKSGNAQVILSVCGQDIIKNVVTHSLPVPVVNYPVGLCKNEVANVSTTFDFESQLWKDSSGIILSMDSSTTLQPGYYSVDVTDLNGCVGTTFFEIEFYPTPTAHISTLSLLGFCGTVDPLEIVANTDGINYDFQWYLDGSPVGNNSPKYTASDFGFYQVEVTNQFGCKVVSNTLEIFNWCDNSRPSICNGFACVEYGQLEIDNGEIDCNTKIYDEVSGLILVPGTIQWQIENENGTRTFYNTPTVQHKYDVAGYYTVIVLAELDGFAYPMADCKHLVYIKDTVELASRFDYHGACANSIIRFKDLSTFLPDYGITDWAWDFGDGNGSSDQDPDHIYTSAGDFNVTLVTTSTSGCTSTAERSIHVNPVPTLTIDVVAQACEDNPVQFEVNSGQQLFDIEWDFLDPTSSNNDANSKITYHTYEAAGNYFPSVTASNIHTCVASISAPVEIFTNDLVGDITTSNGTLLCEGDSTELTSPSGGTLWIWNTDELTESISVNEVGHFDVIVENQYGCQYAPDPIFIEIQPKPIVTINGRELFGPGDVGQWQDTLETCQGVDLELMTFANALVTYEWSTTEITSSISFTNEDGTLLPAGVHQFSVRVTDTNTNCESDPAEITVIVHDNPQVFTVSLVSGTGCSESTNILRVDVVEPGVVYTWSDGQEGSQIEARDQGSYTVVATNQFGCTASSINSVFINPAPRADLIPSGCFTRCNPDTICLPPLDGITYFEILLDGGVLESGSVFPSQFIATVSGSYTFYLEGVNGCSATSEPLDLELYPGYGHLEIFVFVDVNENGIFDAGDTTIRGVDVLIHENNVLYNSLPTNVSGIAYFLNVPAGTYVASIDSTMIPAGMSILISNQQIEIVGCDQEFSDTLALAPCVLVFMQTVYLCPGDSVELADTVFYPTADFTYLKPANSAGCDTLFDVTVLPDTSGQFNVYTYLDVNKNGILESSDSLVGNIPIILTDPMSQNTTGSTDINGELIQIGEVGNWRIQIDTNGIPLGWEIIIGDTTITSASCDPVVVNLLLTPECLPMRLDLTVDLCPGDSVLLDGNYYATAQLVEVTVAGGSCDTIKSYDVVLLDAIDVQMMPTDACDGQSNGAVEVQATSSNGFVSIHWGHTIDSDFIQTGLVPNTYSYSIDDGVCSVSGEVMIGEYIFPVVQVNEQDPNCPGATDGQIDIALTSPELTWSLDSINYTTDGFIDLEAGSYTLYFTNGNCVQSQLITLEEKVVVPFDIVTVVDLPMNSMYEFSHNYLDSLAHVFNWSPASYLDCTDCASPTFTGADQDITVLVQVTDPDGCEQQAEILLRVDLNPGIFIPNAFSPNNDAINDHFKPYVKEGVVSTQRLEIYDRWGNQVYQENVMPDQIDIEGWDGKRNGTTHLPGLFLYKADFVYLNGTTKQMTGEVHLVR